MKAALLLYTRKDCCLCEDMTNVVRQVAAKHALEIDEIDVDTSRELQEKYGNEVPVLFVNGRKAFKYRVTREALEKKLGKKLVSELVQRFFR